MHCDWMRFNPCSVVKCIPIECSELNAAWLNAVYNMHREEMEPYWMQWFFYTMNECRGYYGVDTMQHDWMQCILCSMAESIPIECSGFHAAWLKQCNTCSVVKWILIECSGFHAAWRNWTIFNAWDFIQHGRMQWIPCSMIECSGFYAAWPKLSRLNAVDSMHCDWMQWTPCSLVKWIPIECSWFHAAWLNTVDSIQLSKMNPD